MHSYQLESQHDQCKLVQYFVFPSLGSLRMVYLAHKERFGSQLQVVSLIIKLLRPTPPQT